MKKQLIEIPYELQISMQEIFQFLEDSKNDPDQYIDFDDAIQTENVSGGKIGDKKRPYHFTYYDGGKSAGRIWELQLHQTEIEDIGDRVMTEIRLYCCENNSCGYKTREERDRCILCKNAG